METYKKIEAEINEIKEHNQEAGDILHEQMHKAQNAKWRFDELSDYMKTETDVADLYFSDNEQLHADVRNIQDAIINYYAE